MRSWQVRHNNYHANTVNGEKPLKKAHIYCGPKQARWKQTHGFSGLQAGKQGLAHRGDGRNRIFARLQPSLQNRLI
jgi:hypothetical protein